MDEEATSWIRRTKFSQTVSYRLNSSKLASLPFMVNQDKISGLKTIPQRSSSSSSASSSDPKLVSSNSQTREDTSSLEADVYVVDSAIQTNPVTNKQRSVSPSPQMAVPDVFKEARSERKRFSTPHPRRVESEKGMKPKLSHKNSFEKRSFNLRSPSGPIRDLGTLRIQERVKSKKDTGWSKLFDNTGRRVSAVEASEEFRVDMSKLFFGLKFAHGLYSRLYHGKYEDKAVAVKLITVPDDDDNGCLGARLEKQFTKEVTLLSRLTHPNVIKFVGAYKDPPVYCVLTQYLPEGSLRSFLHKPENRSLPLKKLIEFALDIARGMEYIHSRHIIHRDLKPENVLIDEDFHLKIADFGIACEEEYCDMLADDPGTYRWMAPEMIKRKPHGRNSSSISDLDDLARLLDRPRLNIERKRSFDERSFSEMGIFDNVNSPGGWETPVSSARNSFEPHPMVAEAWDALRRSLVYFRGQPVGTIAAYDHASEEVLNYDQVFVRDFVPSALAFLMNGEPDIVKNFLLKTIQIQGREKRIDRFKLGEGAMPASFKVIHDPIKKTDTIIADFGESAIGRVAPVDSGFWWIILLRAYTKSTGDTSLAETPECQKGMRLILSLCLSEGFDTFPTLLCADGCSMVDRRMGVYGYPIEIQALFFMALRSAMSMLKHDAEGKEFMERIVKRLHALSFHMRSYFWLDFQQLNDIYRYKTEEYSHTAVNKFNVIPDSIPEWVFDFMPLRGGYFIGNVSPARMDFRWFALGNCVAILASLATPEQSAAIMDLIEERWEELVGEMPVKICHPAIESHEWRIVTGCDPKNTLWSYHNGGSWPVLLWLLTAACIKTGRPQIARRAIDLAEARLLKDGWPEYYDGKSGRFIGKQARKFQTWSIAGYLVAKMLLEDPSHLGMISLEEDKQTKPVIKRSYSWT